MSELNDIKARGISGLCKELRTTFRNTKTSINIQ